jgi:hypothetical protein
MMRYLESCSPNNKVACRTFACGFLRATGAVLSLLVVVQQLGARPQARAVGVQNGQVAGASGEPEVVQGTVINRVTREPIARALVYTPDNRFAVLTDDRGHFEFKFPPRDIDSPPPNSPPSEDPEEARAQQRATQLWFLRNTRFANFFAKRPGYLALDNTFRRTTDAKPSGPLIIEMEPESRIIGRVQFPEADVAEHGQIQIYRQEFEEGQPSWRMVDTVKIRANGEFRFADLPAGTYKLFTTEQMERVPPVFNPRSQMFGYPPIYFPNSKDFASAMPIHLTAGATFEGNISLVRREYYPVKIGVSGATAGGGVLLAVYPQGHPGPGYDLGFDPGEGVIQGLLPDGSYTLKVTLEQNQGSSGVLNFTVRGGPVDGVSMALVPNISLAVDVKTDFKIPSRNQSVIIEGNHGSIEASNIQFEFGMSLFSIEPLSNGRAVQAEQTPASPGNEWTIRNIAPGSYRVQIRTPWAYAASAIWGGVDLLRDPLVVGTDGAGTPIEVVLHSDGAEVSGTVQEARHDNLPGAKDALPAPNGVFVYFVPTSDSEGQFREVRAMNGQFSLGMIPPGTYRLLAFVSEQKEMDFRNAEEMRKFESKGVVLSLAPNQRVEMQAPLTLLDEP